DTAGVIEGITVDTHPAAQELTAGVVPGDTSVVDAGAGGLANHQNAGAAVGPHYRIGAEGQVVTEGAGAYFFQQRYEGVDGGYLFRLFSGHGSDSKPGC